MRPLLLAAALAVPMTVAAAASSDQERLRDARLLAAAIEGRVPGTPVNCLPENGRLYATQLVGDVVLFIQNKQLAYISRTDGDCNVAAQTDIRLSLPRNVRVCSGSVLAIRQVFPAIELGACKVTKFVPYTKTQ